MHTFWRPKLLTFVCSKMYNFYEIRQQAAVDHRERACWRHMSNPRSCLHHEYSKSTFALTDCYCFVLQVFHSFISLKRRKCYRISCQVLNGILGYLFLLIHISGTQSIQLRVNTYLDLYGHTHTKQYVLVPDVQRDSLITFVGMQPIFFPHLGLSPSQDASLYPTLWREHLQLWNEHIHQLFLLQRSCHAVWKQQLCLGNMENGNRMW